MVFRTFLTEYGLRKMFMNFATKISRISFLRCHPCGNPINFPFSRPMVPRLAGDRNVMFERKSHSFARTLLRATAQQYQGELAEVKQATPCKLSKCPNNRARDEYEEGSSSARRYSLRWNADCLLRDGRCLPDVLRGQPRFLSWYRQ